MRTLSTVVYGLFAALVLVAVASHMIGSPDPDAVRRGGLTAATVLGSDGAQADTTHATQAPSS